MDLQQAINNPDVNVFDIVEGKEGRFNVYTYRKPGETDDEYKERDYKNLLWASKFMEKQKTNRQLTNKGHGNTP